MHKTITLVWGHTRSSADRWLSLVGAPQAHAVGDVVQTVNVPARAVGDTEPVGILHGSSAKALGASRALRQNANLPRTNKNNVTGQKHANHV